MRFIARTEDTEVIEQILAHLKAKAGEPEAPLRPPCLAPPQQGLFDETGRPQDDFAWIVPSAALPWRLAGKQTGEQKHAGKAVVGKNLMA
jgi:hypothetical protein